MKARYKWQPATYTLAGVGGQAQTYTDTNGGRLWSVVLQDNEGKTEVIKALGVPKILRDTVGHHSYRELAKRFPDVSPRVFDVLPDHKLDLLIGNANLLLQPKCRTGVGCKDCLQDLC